MCLKLVYHLRKNTKELNQSVWVSTLKVSRKISQKQQKEIIVITNETHSNGSPAEYVYTELTKTHGIPSEFYTNSTLWKIQISSSGPAQFDIELAQTKYKKQQKRLWKKS